MGNDENARLDLSEYEVKSGVLLILAIQGAGRLQTLLSGAVAYAPRALSQTARKLLTGTVLRGLSPDPGASWGQSTKDSPLPRHKLPRLSAGRPRRAPHFDIPSGSPAGTPRDGGPRSRAKPFSSCLRTRTCSASSTCSLATACLERESLDLTTPWSSNTSTSRSRASPTPSSTPVVPFRCP